MVTPTVPSTSTIFLGEGAIFKDYQGATPVSMGATQGGSQIDIEMEWRDPDYDGKYGKTKGLKRLIRVDATLKINAMEISANLLKDFFGGFTSSTESGYTEIIPSLDIDDIEYLDDVAFVGETLAGKTVAIILENALGDGNLSMKINAKEEIVPEVQFSAHYDPSTPTTVPVKIWIYS